MGDKMPSISGSSARRGAAAAPIKLQRAATLVANSYKKSRNHGSLTADVDIPFDEGDVQALLMNNRTLLIPGSNSVWDYIKFNFRPFNIGGKKYSFKTQTTGEKIGHIWHQGFLAHAMAVHAKFDQKRPNLIIGHSLGAASAQVLSMIWDVPAICFAAPRVYLGGGAIGDKNKCLCIVLEDDPVRNLPTNKFDYVGDVRPLGKNNLFRMKHRMSHYEKAVMDPAIKSKLPDQWPSAT